MDWTNMARAIGGTLISGTFTSRPRIEYEYKHWKIIIDDEHDLERGGLNNHYTRIKAVFSNKKMRTLLISPKSRIIRKKNTILVDDEDINANYVLRSNSKELVDEICSDEEIKKLLMRISKRLKDKPILGLYISRFGIGRTLKLKNIFRRESMLLIRLEGYVQHKRDMGFLVDLICKVLEKCEN